MALPPCPNEACGTAEQVSKYGTVIRGKRGQKRRYQRYRCSSCGATFVPKKYKKPWQKKQAISGHKSTKGVPESHDELKKNVSLSLTPTATAGLDAIASSLGISRSSLVENIGRGIISIPIEKQRKNRN